MEERDREKDWIEKLVTVGKESSENEEQGNEEQKDTEMKTESNSAETSSGDGMFMQGGDDAEEFSELEPAETEISEEMVEFLLDAAAGYLRVLLRN